MLDVVFGPVAVECADVVVAEKLLISIQYESLVFLCQLFLLYDSLRARLVGLRMHRSGESRKGNKGGSEVLALARSTSQDRACRRRAADRLCRWRHGGPAAWHEEGLRSAFQG